MRLGEPEAAMRMVDEALALAPGVAQLWISKGQVLRDLDLPDRALAAFVQARALSPESYHPHLELGLLESELGHVHDAAASLLRAWRLRDDDEVAKPRLLRLLHEHPGAFASREAHAAEPVRSPRVCVVVCSVDPGKFARVSASYARALHGCDHEIIGIHDAKSLAEAYNHALDRCRGDVVVFSHDDVEILSGDLGAALGRAIEQADVVGVVGTVALAGPGWAWGGRRPARGRIVQPAEDGRGLELFAFSPPRDVETGIHAIDGAFMAARLEAARFLRFDAATFDGFHLYDLDFSHRAHRAGLRVGVTQQVLVRHDSRGSFDERWSTYAGRFLSKFSMAPAPPVLDHLPPSLVFADDAEVAALCGRLDALGRGTGH